MRALISVSDKTGVVEFADGLKRLGWDIIATGGTMKLLRDAGLEVINISDVTGFPEICDGRVKTLHPKVHGGLLARRDLPSHLEALRENGIEFIDMVCVNLYPFRQTIAKEGVSMEDAIENIDIGGPSMLRSAAKNYRDVTVVCDPQDYGRVLDEIRAGGNTRSETRLMLSAKAFTHTAQYDACIATYLREKAGLPEKLFLDFDIVQPLRYGENPHQQASLYLDPLNQNGFAHAEQLGGKPMSYNNYVDADAAWRAVWDFAPQIAVAVVKHNNPCGLAIGATVAEAHKKAHACDPMSAYGGVIAANSKVTMEMAESVRPIFTEVIVAPDYDADALELLQTKKKNLRILKVSEPPKTKTQFRQIDGGLLVQSTDLIDAPGDDPNAWKLVSGEPADAETVRDLVFAWRAIRCVKSNAILIAHDQATVGIGMGQVNRVDSANLSVERANTLADGANRTKGAVAASDAFFPFADGAEILINAGVKAIVQPGGSIRDEEVFEAARKAGVTMYVTGTRHFFH